MIIDKGNKMALTANSGQNVIVRLEINAKAKRLILRIDERRREAVAIAPSKRKLSEAVGFARDRVDWLAAQLSALPVRTALEDGAIFSLRGAPCQISIDGPGRRASFVPGDPAILQVPGAEETIGRRVERYLRRQAQSDLETAVQHHCRTLNVDARRVTVKDTRSRWGSCTSDGRLAFSWRLIMAPSEVLDYVAAHECAHLLEMNHSAAFWAHVATCRPDWKMQRRWLKAHGQSLHAVGV